MSQESRGGDMESSSLVDTSKPFVFLDYGGLIMDYQFNSETLLRAHKMALAHINSKNGDQVTLKDLSRAHDLEMKLYVNERNRTQREDNLNDMIGEILEHLKVKRASAFEVAQIYELNDHDAIPMPTTMESIPELRNRAKLGIISNLPHNSIYHELEKYGLEGVFRPIILSHEVGYRKPHKIIYQEAINRVGLMGRPHQAIFFSHDQEEVDGALAVGMQSHLVKNLGEVLTKLQTS